MRKIIFLALVCVTAALSEVYPAYLFKEQNFCIEDFYYKNNRFYYKRFDRNRYYSSFNEATIIGGYEYNDSNRKCTFNDRAKSLGLTGLQYNFFVALLSVLVGFVWLFFITYSFVEALRRR